MFDKNNDGDMELSEFKFAIPAPQKIKKEDPTQDDKSDDEDEKKREELVQDAVKEFNEQGNDEKASKKWLETIEKLDTDGDGKVSLDEFSVAINKFITEAYKC